MSSDWGGLDFFFLLDFKEKDCFLLEVFFELAVMFASLKLPSGCSYMLIISAFFFAGFFVCLCCLSGCLCGFFLPSVSTLQLSLFSGSLSHFFLHLFVCFLHFIRGFEVSSAYSLSAAQPKQNWKQRGRHRFGSPHWQFTSLPTSIL